MVRKLGRYLAALTAAALALPGVAWAAEKMSNAAGACCGLCCG